MHRAHLPNLNAVTDQLRVDNATVAAQSESFLLSGDATPQTPIPQTPSSPSPDSPTTPDHSKPDVFPFMRAYGCLGPKPDQSK